MPINDVRFGRKRQTHVYGNDPNKVYLGDTRNLSEEDKQTVRSFRARHGGNYDARRSQVNATSRLITHEEVHHAILKQAPRGSKDSASRGLDRGMLYNAVNKTGACSNCGQSPDHRHGKHLCCGSALCHMTIGASHMVAGEAGLLTGSLSPRFDW